MSRNTILYSALALAVLGMGIYVMLTWYGNDAGGYASTKTKCSMAAANAAAVEEAANGQVAGYRKLDDPADLSSLKFVKSDGSDASISEWSGRTVLLNLWATWCAPCREEMPALEELQEARGGEGFEVVAVSIDLDSADKPKAFYDEIGLSSLGFYQDATSDIFYDLKKRGIAFGMPTTILIDRNGCGLGVLNGAAHWSSPDAFRLVDAALSL